nr:hypothetical protein [Tanacetum cinerariifolium]
MYAHRAWTGYEDRSEAIEAHVRTLEEQTMEARDLKPRDEPAEAERDTDRSRNGDDSHDSGTGKRKQASTIRECTYTDFLKSQPLNFKGTEGVFGLTQWIIGHDVAYAIPWKTLKKMMTDKNTTQRDLNICVLNATITMMGIVLPSVLTAKGLAVRPVTVKSNPLLPTTTREPKGKIKEFSLALSVELRAISGVIAR